MEFHPVERRTIRTRRHVGELASQEWVRTFSIITTNSNELVNCIHDRMQVIIAPEDYTRWLSTLEPNPRDLLVPYPAEPMWMWPISKRVNKPDNDDASILESLPSPDERA
jgi:putative SOS response-associated peptidase YedK